MALDIACNDGGIIYVQGEQNRTVTEATMLDALYEDALAARVERGEAELSTTGVTIAPPDPLRFRIPRPIFNTAKS